MIIESFECQFKRLKWRRMLDVSVSVCFTDEDTADSSEYTDQTEAEQ